jgi:hypothetical protein
MLAVGKINERPIFQAGDEFIPHGIFQNVIGLLPSAFIMLQVVLKEFPLPADAISFAVHSFHLLTTVCSDLLDGGKEINAANDPASTGKCAATTIAFFCRWRTVS